MELNQQQQHLGNECDEDLKVVIAPVFHGRLEESSERTSRAARTWSNAFQNFAFPTTTTNREAILAFIYVLLGIVLLISIFIIIRMLISSKSRMIKERRVSQN